MSNDLGHLVCQWIEEVSGDLRMLSDGFFTRHTHERGARTNAIVLHCVEFGRAMRRAGEV